MCPTPCFYNQQPQVIADGVHMTKNTQNNFGFRIKPFTGSHTARNSVDSSRNSTENASYADDMKMGCSSPVQI